MPLANPSGANGSRRPRPTSMVNRRFSRRSQPAMSRAVCVQAVFVTTDQTHTARDMAGWLRLENRRFTIEVGRGRRDAFAPLGFAKGIQTVDSLNPTPLTGFIAARASVTVVPGLALSGWYFDPVVGGGDFEPPRHGRVSAAFYSKFWRVFKS